LFFFAIASKQSKLYKVFIVNYCIGAFGKREDLKGYIFRVM